MSMAYQMAMPVIIYCLGGEMIYILCSRLKAQEIPEDKSIKVIHDVVQSLFERKFISELTKRKDMSKHQEVRQMFEKLAHSSIMRLNPTSMTKLFELMLMALKLQILRAKYAEEIYKVTLNHLESVLAILINQDPKGNSQIIEYVTEAMDKFVSSYKKLSPYDFVILRESLLRFLQGKNVKVSIFIQKSLQSGNSILYLPMREVAPPYTRKPGIVQKFDSKGNVIADDFFELKLSNDYIQNPSTERLNNFSNDFGLNMFSNENKLRIVGRENIKDVTQDLTPAQEISEQTTQPFAQSQPPISSSPEEGKKPTLDMNQFNKNRQILKESSFLPEDKEPVDNKKLLEEQKKKLSQSTKKEFNELSDLLSVPASNDTGTFKLDLFKSHQGGSAEERGDFIDIEIDNSNLKSKYEACFNIEEAKGNEEDEGDDLLDLMDKATK